MSRPVAISLALLVLAAACGGDDRRPPIAAIELVPPSIVVAPRGSAHFSARVVGGDDARVLWSADGGVIEQDGTWTAPEASGAYHIRAQSIADPGKSASATATVSDGVVIRVEPTSVVLSAGGPPFPFEAVVTGTWETGVAWSIQEPSGGATIDATGRFTAAWGGTFRVVATSLADPTQSAHAIVTAKEDLIDHGGPVVPAARVFALWWGEAAQFPPDARDGVESFLAGLDGSRYLAVLDQYMRGATATTRWAGSFTDESPPPDLPAFEINAGACRMLDVNGIAPEPGDVVVVVTSNVPAQSTPHCGTHSYTQCEGQSVLIVHLPNPAGSNFCEARSDPCGTGYTPATLSLITGAAHELVETMTNPFSNAWHRDGRAAMDRCGTPACISLDGRTMLVPEVYSNAVHGCVVE